MCSIFHLIYLDDLTRQMSLDTTLALIQAAAAEAEEESEVSHSLRK